jgi:hypothetical protein
VSGHKEDAGRLLSAYALIGRLHADLLHAESVAEQLVQVICDDAEEVARLTDSLDEYRECPTRGCGDPS